MAGTSNWQGSHFTKFSTRQPRINDDINSPDDETAWAAEHIHTVSSLMLQAVANGS
jgi:hypothetical protein